MWLCRALRRKSRDDVILINQLLRPTLSTPIANKTGSTTADLFVNASKASGALFWVISTSVTKPTAAQIQAGKDSSGATVPNGSQAIEFVGAQTASATGLAASTTYFAHFVQVDERGTASAVVTSASFTEDSPPALAISGVAPDASLGSAYSFTPTVVGGTPPYTYAITSGSLPAWATLNTATGEISGVPV